jgi:hypothetical protein
MLGASWKVAMIGSLATGIFLITGWAIGMTGGPVGIGTTELPPELRSAMAERKKANLQGDTEKIESQMVDEFLQTDIYGRVQNNAEWLTDYFKPLAALIKAGRFRWEIWEEKDVQARQFGDVVVVVGSLTLKGSGASPVPGKGWVASPQAVLGPAVLRFTRVWIKRNGKWVLAANHNALPPEQGKK